MKKITDAQRRARIQPLLDYWLPIIGLSGWEITWSLADKINTKKLVSGAAGAGVNTVPPYHQAHIKFERHDVDSRVLPQELEYMALHELAHLVLHRINLFQETWCREGRFADEIQAVIEPTCDHIAGALYHSRHGKSYGAPYSPMPEGLQHV